MSTVPNGEMSVRLYREMRRAEVPSFFLPEAWVHDVTNACAFLRGLADEMEAYQRKEFPDGIPF